MKMNESLDGIYCGRRIHQTEKSIIVDQTKAANSVENVQFNTTGLLTPEEKTSYKGVLGQILWLACQTRPDLAVQVSLLARKGQSPTAQDAKELNKLAKLARETSGRQLVYPRGIIDLATATLVTWADSSFANIDDVHSQFGLLIVATHNPEAVVAGNFSQCIVLGWNSGKCRRVVRSTLAAEGYATTEGIESTWWHRYLMVEMQQPEIGLKAVETEASKVHSLVLSDSDSIVKTAHTDRSTSKQADKIFKITIAMLREAIEKGQGVSLRWVPTWSMVADPLTKLMEAGALLSLMAATKHTFKRPPPKKASDVLAVLAALPALCAGSRATETISLTVSAEEAEQTWPIFEIMIMVFVCLIAFLIGRFSRPSRPREKAAQQSCRQKVAMKTAAPPPQSSATESSDDEPSTPPPQPEPPRPPRPPAPPTRMTAATPPTRTTAAQPPTKTTRTVATQSQTTYSAVRGVCHPRFEVTRHEGLTIESWQPRRWTGN